MATAERRIILLGNTGNGKSTTGNTLLGSHEFAECRSPQPKTQGCQFRKHFNDKRQMSYTIVDTPGFMCTDGNLAEHLLEIQKSIVICPEPHAFLLIFSPSRQLDENDRIFDLLRVAFGEQVFNHCIVVFTHGNYFSTDEEFTQYWQASNMLLKLVDSCGGRIIRIKNETSTLTGLSLGDDVNRIYDNVENISDSGTNIYNCETIQMHKNVLRESMVRNKASRYIQQITTLVLALGFKEIKDTAERRIILIGKTGNGKSSTGNSLLGQQAFKVEKSPKAVTQNCNLRKRYSYKKNLIYAVVDTPGLMDTEAALAQRLLEIQKALEYSANPHVFLLVFSSADRMTQDEVYTIDMLRVTFGEKVFDHAIVVYTRGGEFSTDEEFTKYWEKSELLVEYVKRCGGRIIRIENRDSLDIDSNENVKKIYDLIEQMSNSGRRVYHYKYIKTHKQVLKNHLKNYNSEAPTLDQISALSESLKKHLRPDMWSAIIVGATFAIVAGGALACEGSRAGVVTGASMAAAGVASLFIAKQTPP